jgi:hypothetical protein
MTGVKLIDQILMCWSTDAGQDGNALNEPVEIGFNSLPSTAGFHDIDIGDQLSDSLYAPLKAIAVDTAHEFDLCPQCAPHGLGRVKMGIVEIDANFRKTMKALWSLPIVVGMAGTALAAPPDGKYGHLPCDLQSWL